MSVDAQVTAGRLDEDATDPHAALAWLCHGAFRATDASAEGFGARQHRCH
jgi:hypothetical protein